MGQSVKIINQKPLQEGVAIVSHLARKDSFRRTLGIICLHAIYELKLIQGNDVRSFSSEVEAIRRRVAVDKIAIAQLLFLLPHHRSIDGAHGEQNSICLNGVFQALRQCCSHYHVVFYVDKRSVGPIPTLPARGSSGRRWC